MPGCDCGLKQNGIISLAVELADPDRGRYRAPEGSARALGIESKLGRTRKIVNRTAGSMMADTN